MAIAVRLCILSAALSAGTASDSSLEAKLAELEQQFRQNHEHIATLEEHKRRRLSSDPTPSIYGWSGKRNTRPYTASEDFEGALTHTWLILSGALVMFMQAGFAMLEAGCCRRKFVQNILLKNLTDVCVGTLGWWWFGWSIAYSGPYYKDAAGNTLLKNGFGGHEQFAGHMFLTESYEGNIEPSMALVNWFFQWAFASAAATIVSGGVAERVKFPGYVIYSFLLTSFIYPVIVAWTWGYGWLASVNKTGYMDFAGSGVVHLTGGIGALVGAIIAGPRNGRFKAPRGKLEAPYSIEERDPFAPHSLPLVVLGTFILWFGWYGFNCGSTLAMNGIEDGFKAAQVAMNTTIAASVAGITVFVLRFALLRKYDVGAFCNGVLGGLVSITAPCGNVECGSALVIGLIGAILYQLASTTLQLLKIDDPLDAFPIHGVCGIWGVFAAALFDWGKGFDTVHAWSGFRCMMDSKTNTCATGLGGDLLAANVLEIVFVIVWAGGLSMVIFVPLKLGRMLVATPEEQDRGFDEAKHSPAKAYDFQGQEASQL